MGVFPFQRKTHMVEPGTEPGTSWLVVRSSDRQATRLDTQTVYRTTQLTNWEDCGPCPVFAIYTLLFSLQLRKKHEKNLSQGSRRIPVGTMKTEYTEQSIHNNKNT